MPQKRFLVLIAALIPLLPMAGVAAAPSLEDLWRKGDFNAVETRAAVLISNPQSSQDGFLETAAALFEIRFYDSAAGMYAAYAQGLMGVGREYVDVKTKEYESRWLADPGNTNAAWIAKAQEDIQGLIADGALNRGITWQTGMELDYLLARTTGAAPAREDSLFKELPDSPVTLKAAKDEINRITLVRNSNSQSDLIDQFLEDFPGNYWRHVAYRLVMYGAWVSGDKEKLAASAEEYLAEYPNHPASLGSVSRYFFEADIQLEDGLAYARRSKELYETALGLDGLPSGLSRMNQETRGAPMEPEYLPPGHRSEFLDYLGSRYNLARYLLAVGDKRGALGLVAPVIELEPYTAVEEQTLAPFMVIAAKASMDEKDYREAYRLYLAALIEGDARNRFGLEAEAGMQRAADELLDSEAEGILSSLVADEYGQVRLPYFTDITQEAQLEGVSANSLSWGDVNGDGYPDLLFGGDKLYMNSGTGPFVDMTSELRMPIGMVGGVFCDYDNDGDLDIYSIAAPGTNDALLRNEGSRFMDMTALSGFPSEESAAGAACWLDFNGDGFADLFSGGLAPQADTDGGGWEAGADDVFYLSNGGRIFDRTPEGTLTPLQPFGTALPARCAAVADFDNDGSPDVFTGNYNLAENLLWQFSLNGPVDNARPAGLAGWSKEGYWGSTTGAAWGDIENDGDFDLFATNMEHPSLGVYSDRSQLLINSPGNYLFKDRASDWGIKADSTHSSVVLLDANNDGWLDAFVTSAYSNRRSYLYLNDSGIRFLDATYLAGARLFDAWGSAVADFDLDGDMDIAVGSSNGVKLLRNDQRGGRWLEVECIGAAYPGYEYEEPETVDSAIEAAMQINAGLPENGGDEPGAVDGPGAETPPEAAVDAQPVLADLPLSNRSAIGAKVIVSNLEGLVLTREIQSGHGAACGNDLVAHFGLGDAIGPFTVSVYFPSGRIVMREIPTANRRIEVYELEPGTDNGGPGSGGGEDLRDPFSR